ncbi:MAG TPA: type II toxin-antitoxin system HicB family antitoxin [Verrucomicrobiae bacterium]|nr:type II toxin-antitoxin system HicB family antitoxin [Verrucomicrobiae bacterium]
MKSFTAVVERNADTGLLVGYVQGFPGAHSQAESLDELRGNLREVISMLLEDREPVLQIEFVGAQSNSSTRPMDADSREAYRKHIIDKHR